MKVRYVEKGPVIKSSKTVKNKMEYKKEFAKIMSKINSIPFTIKQERRLEATTRNNGD